MATEAAPGEGTRLFHPGYHGHDPISARTFGFWLYMLSDALIFTSLFATYGVLDNPMSTNGGPMAPQIVHPIEGFWQTCIVLGSVLAYSLATVGLRAGRAGNVAMWMIVSLLLAVAFLGLEVHDLADLAAAGAGPDRSGYLSAYFILVATHGLHMVFGILWMLVMLVQIPRFGFSTNVVARLLNLRLFWQFQASVWIVMYVYVYLIGAF